MLTNLNLILLGLLAVGSAMMAGLFFVFSNFTMAALSKIKPEAGMSAMQAINITIINPWFMALFLGTAIGSLVVSVLAIINWDHPASVWALGGGALYLAGCFLVTACFNVPLNNMLAAVNPMDPGSVNLWMEYVAKWVPWNHVRTVTTLLASAAYIIAIIRLSSN